MPDLTALENAIDALDAKVQASITASATTTAGSDQAEVDKLTQHIQHLEDLLSTTPLTNTPPLGVAPGPGPLPTPPAQAQASAGVAAWTPPAG